MIVIIDDSEIDTFINRKLVDAGEIDLKIETFLDPIEGLNFVLITPEVQVVIIDNVMPGYSGYEIAESIRKSRKDVRISILTASLDPRDVSRFTKLDESIQLWEKPIDVQLLKNFLSSQI